MAAGSGGLPIHFSIMGGELHDYKETPNLVAELPKADYAITESGYLCT